MRGEVAMTMVRFIFLLGALIYTSIACCIGGIVLYLGGQIMIYAADHYDWVAHRTVLKLQRGWVWPYGPIICTVAALLFLAYVFNDMRKDAQEVTCTSCGKRYIMAFPEPEWKGRLCDTCTPPSEEQRPSCPRCGDEHPGIYN